MNKQSTMKTLHALLAAVAIGAPQAAGADGGPAKKNAHAGHKEQKEHKEHKEQKAWGIAGDVRAVRRTIEVKATDDMRFSPDRIEVRQGETVRLVVRNKGKVLHELVLGTKAELDEHAAMMAKFPGMEHDEPHMAHARPGKSGAVVWNFNRAGEFEYACLIPGHYPAGMVGKVIVTPPAGKRGG